MIHRSISNLSRYISPFLNCRRKASLTLLFYDCFPVNYKYLFFLYFACNSVVVVVVVRNGVLISIVSVKIVSVVVV